MYFAINPALATLPASISEHMAELRNADVVRPLHLFALIDGAFDEQFFTTRYRTRLVRQSLYANTALAAIGAAAPYLLTAPAAATEQLGWLQQLFAACKGMPMLSIIASTLDIGALEQHLRPYLIAVTQDTVEWPVRWGDTRVLPALLAALTESQRSHLLSPIHCWWSAQRDGTLLSWQGTAEPETTPADFDKLPLDDAAFVSLVDAAEADAVLANIDDAQHDLLRNHSPAQCHARVAHHLALASANGIEAAGARQHFSTLALSLTGDFSHHPAMATLLQRTRQGADYTGEVAALPASFWQETTL